MARRITAQAGGGALVTVTVPPTWTEPTARLRRSRLHARTQHRGRVTATSGHGRPRTPSWFRTITRLAAR